MGALGAGLVATALPAYANVLSSYYTIGTPSGGVSTVSATPATVGASASTSFSVTFTTAAALAGSSNASVTITLPTTTLTSAPTSIDLIGGNCIQAGTAGQGGSRARPRISGMTIYLISSCSISAGTSVTVAFTANAPATTGTSFYFTVTTSSNVTPANSNTISVGTSGATLTAASPNFGVSTIYTISNVAVSGLAASQNVITLSVVPAGTISLYTGGAAGYTVTYTPSGGTPTSDVVTNITPASTSVVSLTLATPVANGYTLNITATATNPGSATTAYMTVQPATGAAQATNSITFGNSVTGATVAPASPLAGAATTYTVSFRTSSALAAGGDINLSELAGPTNFATVTGVSLNDTTKSRTIVVTGPPWPAGRRRCRTSFTINAGDSIVLTLVNVTNPRWPRPFRTSRSPRPRTAWLPRRPPTRSAPTGARA